MQAIILAAGAGSRLNWHVSETAKCLTDIGDRLLLDYQLSVLRQFGIMDVCVVVGACAETVISGIGNRCHYILNDRYRETNSLYSLWLARDWATEPLLVSNGDLLAAPAIYERLLATPGNALAFDSSSEQDDEHMKVSFDMNGGLRTISKSLPRDQVHGENIGLIKYEASTAAELFRQGEPMRTRPVGKRLWCIQTGR